MLLALTQNLAIVAQVFLVTFFVLVIVSVLIINWLRRRPYDPSHDISLPELTVHPSDLADHDTPLFEEPFQPPLFHERELKKVELPNKDYARLLELRALAARGVANLDELEEWDRLERRYQAGGKP